MDNRLPEAAAACREAIRALLPWSAAAPYVHSTAANVLADHYVYGHDLDVLDTSPERPGGSPEHAAPTGFPRTAVPTFGFRSL
ncbi:hypothetical protein ABZ372_35185, partial [Streptomyces sp. NPDC005921]